MASLQLSEISEPIGEGFRFFRGFLTGGYRISGEQAITLLTLTSGVAGGFSQIFASQRLGRLDGPLDANDMFLPVTLSFVATLAAGAIFTPTIGDHLFG